MNDKLNEAMDHIGDVHLFESMRPKRRRRAYWISGIVAVVALALILIPLLGIDLGHKHVPSSPLWSQPPENLDLPHASQPTVPDATGIVPLDQLQLPNLLAAPNYPQMAALPRMEDYPNYKEYNTRYETWQKSQAAQYNQPHGYADNLSDFFLKSIRQFLNAGENSAYSPINVYMALAMLAETTDGTSRQQVLDALELDSIEALRTQAGHIWNAHFSDDSVTTLLLGSSLWLDDAFSFHQETVDRLTQHYYASTFRGDLGTFAMDQQLQAWLNANTGGLLQEQAKQVKLDPSTVFSLATTVYFSAGWEAEFLEKNNQDMVFHSASGDLIATFMRQSFTDHTYYWSDHFSAIQLPLSGENAMWLILPDEGYTVSDILASDDYLQMTMNPSGWVHKGIYKVHLSLPKFDVCSSTNLTTGLRAMGIRDVFDPDASNFTPISDLQDLYLSGATHAARVVIDEEGCVAAGFTVLTFGTTSAPLQFPEIQFTLDRPFVFVVSSRDDLPLFAGVVAQP